MHQANINNKCIIYDYNDNCLECEVGFVNLMINSIFYYCIKITDNCLTYSDNFCDTCDSEYVLDMVGLLCNQFTTIIPDCND